MPRRRRLDIENAMSFAFRNETLARLEELCRDFPNRPAALIPALYLVQEEENHLNEENLSALAEFLDMPKSTIYQTATFYSLFDFKQLGRHVIRVCRSICCYLRGGDLIEEQLEKALGIRPGESSPDGLFTLKHSECLAACDRAPCMQIDDKIYGPLAPDDVVTILDAFRGPR